MEHIPADKDDWQRIIRRAELPFTTKGIAVWLAIFADQDGSNVRPGDERLADETGLTTRAIREHRDALRALGLIERMNRGTAVRGRADLYQLTFPGPGYEPVPMRFDPDGNRITPPKPVRKRKPKAPKPDLFTDSENASAAQETALIGTPGPVDDPVTGTGVPVDNPTYRNHGAGKSDGLAVTYRNPGSDLPEPLSTVTGTGVPPTNQTNHYQPTNPSGSPWTDPSPEPQTILGGDGLWRPPPITPAEYATARALLGAVDDTAWFVAAIGDPAPTLVITRVSDTRPEGT